MEIAEGQLMVGRDSNVLQDNVAVKMEPAGPRLIIVALLILDARLVMERAPALVIPAILSLHLEHIQQLTRPLLES